MEDNIEKYILEASDLELLSEGRLLITTEKRKILLKGISKEKIDEYYEIFGKKFRKNKVKKSKYLRVFWSDDEIRYLKENYLKKDINEIVLVIKKSNYQINLMLGKLKLIVKREWSIAEVEFLKNNIENSTIRLAEELNRSVASIKAKKRLLRLLEI